MNFVEPIRDKNIIDDMCTYLKNKNKRDCILFMSGIYIGLRISDLLLFKVKDLKLKRKITIFEKKTGKQKIFNIPDEFYSILNQYLSERIDYEYIFKSRHGTQDITIARAYQILKEAGEHFGLENIGTHTMRKTFGYWYYKNYNDIVGLMKILNHSSEAITKRYIGIEQEELNRKQKNFKLIDKFKW